MYTYPPMQERLAFPRSPPSIVLLLSTCKGLSYNLV